MEININYQLLEQNMCPRCMAAFQKYATCHDDYISCGGCGFRTAKEIYHPIIQNYVKNHFAPKKDEDD